MNGTVYGILLVQLMLVTWADVKTTKISNLWSYFNIIFCLFLYVFSPAYHWQMEVLLFPLGFIVIGFLLFLVKVMGAGDSKYLSSLFLVIPLSLHWTYFENLLISTVFIGGILLTMKVALNFQILKGLAQAGQWGSLKNKIASRFSYAPVILIAWLLLGIKLWK